MTENEEKRLQMVREKMAKLKAQEKTLLLKDRIRQRKERTRRLIQNGALAEKYLNCEGIPPNEFERVLKELVEIQAVKTFLKSGEKRV
jgi:Fic family protein